MGQWNLVVISSGLSRSGIIDAAARRLRNSFRRHFLSKMWPILLAFLLFTVCRIFLSSLTLCNTSFLTWSSVSCGSVNSEMSVFILEATITKLHRRTHFRFRPWKSLSWSTNCQALTESVASSHHPVTLLYTETLVDWALRHHLLTCIGQCSTQSYKFSLQFETVIQKSIPVYCYYSFFVYIHQNIRWPTFQFTALAFVFKLLHMLC